MRYLAVKSHPKQFKFGIKGVFLILMGGFMTLIGLLSVVSLMRRAMKSNSLSQFFSVDHFYLPDLLVAVSLPGGLILLVAGIKFVHRRKRASDDDSDDHARETVC
ncbi:MAG TPA: hypothetical protein PLO61_10195 [Fimbriimonadaceae bacterium]|nr:hypothetical protein [Fimbriimonadaceae bacterium]HRJ33988.1 hypothetical protein [Fimbriimonadaceae bacterium]